MKQGEKARSFLRSEEKRTLLPRRGKCPVVEDTCSPSRARGEVTCRRSCAKGRTKFEVLPNCVTIGKKMERLNLNGTLRKENGALRKTFYTSQPRATMK